MNHRCNFLIVTDESNAEWLTLRDVGPHDQFLTITNDAENVVPELVRHGVLAAGQRLRYYDSEGELTEIIFEGQRFIRFGFLTAGT